MPTPRPRIGLLALGLLAAAQAQADGLTKMQACALIADAAERLKCYDATSGRDRLVKAFKGTPPVNQAEVEGAFPKPPQALKNVFVRATTDVNADNDKPAELALVHSAGHSTGTARIAVLWVPSGSLDRSSTEKTDYTGYAALGFARDMTTPAKPVATQDFRLGLWRNHVVQDKSGTGYGRSSDFAIAAINDDGNAARRTLSAEYASDWTKRWWKNDNFERATFNFKTTAGLTAFVDRTLKEAGKTRFNSHGFELRMGAELDVPALGRALSRPLGTVAGPQSAASDHWTRNRLVPAAMTLDARHVRELNAAERRNSQASLALRWLLRETAAQEQGIKLARTVGGHFRTGEESDAKTTLTFTWLYGN